MSTNNKNTYNTVRKSIFVLALGLVLLPNHGFALGLGDIQVNSTLNQRLKARIELISAIPEDADALIVKLASREEFIKAGLDRPIELTTLKFKALVENERVYITMTTLKPVREPSLSFLVEANWPTGHLIRQYSILLEPPELSRKNGK